MRVNSIRLLFKSFFPGRGRRTRRPVLKLDTIKHRMRVHSNETNMVRCPYSSKVVLSQIENFAHFIFIYRLTNRPEENINRLSSGVSQVKKADHQFPSKPHTSQSPFPEIQQNLLTGVQTEPELFSRTVKADLSVLFPLSLSLHLSHLGLASFHVAHVLHVAYYTLFSAKV